MRRTIGYRELCIEAARIGGLEMMHGLIGQYRRSTERVVAQSIAGLCGIVYDGNLDTGPTIDVPDSPEGLLL